MQRVPKFCYVSKYQASDSLHYNAVQVLSSSWDGRPFGHNRHGPKIGGCAPFGRLGPHLTQHGQDRGLPSYQVASWSIQLLGHNRHEPKSVGCAPFRGQPGPSSNTMSPGPRPTYVPSGISIHRAVWSQQTQAKNWWAVPPFQKGAGSKSNTMSPGPRPIYVPSGILIHPAVWPQLTWAKKWRGCCAHFWAGDGSPFNTVWPGLKPTSTPSGILINPAIWPKQTWVEKWGLLCPLFGSGSWVPI